MTKKNKYAVGYCRVSTHNQEIDNQVEKVKDFLDSNFKEYDLFSEVVSSIDEREELNKIFDNISKYDVLVVSKLDRLARSMKDLLIRKEILENNDVDIVCIDQPIDTTNQYGDLMFKFMGIFAEFERKMIRERMMEGYSRALEENKVGRKKKIEGDALEKLREWYEEKKYSVSVIQALLNSMFDVSVSKQTIYRYLKDLGLRE